MNNATVEITSGKFAGYLGNVVADLGHDVWAVKIAIPSRDGEIVFTINVASSCLAVYRNQVGEVAR